MTLRKKFKAKFKKDHFHIYDHESDSHSSGTTAVERTRSTKSSSTWATNDKAADDEDEWILKFSMQKWKKWPPLLTDQNVLNNPVFDYKDMLCALHGLISQHENYLGRLLYEYDVKVGDDIRRSCLMWVTAGGTTHNTETPPCMTYMREIKLSLLTKCLNFASYIPIPCTDALSKQLDNANFISKIDWKKWYWQIKKNGSSKQFTALYVVKKNMNLTEGTLIWKQRHPYFSV